MKGWQFAVLVIIGLFGPAVSQLLLRGADKVLYALEADDEPIEPAPVDTAEEQSSVSLAMPEQMPPVISEATIQPGLYGDLPVGGFTTLN